MRRVIALAAGVALVALVSGANIAAAQKKGLSDKSVRTFMNYTWSLIPTQFTPPNGGKTILIDKKKRSEVEVPLDVAREVIRVGRMSAHAQICDVPSAQLLNFRSMMQRELDKKKWSQQQLVYINQLHLTTVMLLTGKIKLIENKDGKDVVINETKSRTASGECDQKQKDQVIKIIRAYVDAGPKFKIAVPKPGSEAAQQKPTEQKPTKTQ